ncbi:MAG: hypothetical protein HY909_07860 [Deltaproteobacteria bacterium]|nr:hypothetical protein [Deltaproteobacteria bacterium]
MLRPRSLFLVLLVMALPSVGGATRSRREPPPRRPRGTTPAPGALCTAELTAHPTVGAGGCFIDERVTRSVGLLRYPCAGGPATAAFATATFSGTVTDGVAELQLTTRFHFSDGCDWQSTQRLHGPLASRHLAYTYTEAPVPGQRGCASSCRATADVELR